MNKLYTAQEIADKLQIKKTTVYELIKRGELYSSKVGKQLRISEQQLKQYLERSGSGNNMPDQKAVSSSTPNGNLQIPELPPESSLLKRDYLLHSSGLILCGQFSPALELLISQMSIHPQGIPVLQSFMNSYNSLYSLYFKKAHIACASLDLEHIRSLVPGVQLSLLCLYEYSIGLYVPSGNPLKLSGLMDFARKDIKIANREKGSTPRIYLDQFLFSEKISPASISGYHTELVSDISTAIHGHLSYLAVYPRSNKEFFFLSARRRSSDARDTDYRKICKKVMPPGWNIVSDNILPHRPY